MSQTTQGSLPSNSQLQPQLSGSKEAITLTNGATAATSSSSYKPFHSEKQLIHTIAWQENEITTIMRTITELLPRNFRLYKDYGDRLMNNGEKFRLQLGAPAQDSKDLFQLLF